MSAPHHYGTMSSQFAGPSINPEFNIICDNVVTNIYTINSSWRTLDNAAKSIGTNRDNQGLRNKIHVTQLSMNQIISITPSDLQKLKVIVRKGDKQKELQVTKLTENFTEALAKYGEIQKLIASKMKANLLMPTHTEIYPNEEGTQLQQQQIQLSRELSFEQDLLLDREARIRQIEADVLDVNQIMRELSAMIHVQGENIDTIENSIDYAATRVEEGTAELLKASQYQGKYRRKLLFLVILGLIISCILITVLVLILKK